MAEHIGGSYDIISHKCFIKDQIWKQPHSHNAAWNDQKGLQTWIVRVGVNLTLFSVSKQTNGRSWSQTSSAPSSVLPSTQHNRNCTRRLLFLQKPSVTTVWINTAITQQKSFSLRLDWVKMWIIWIRHWDLQKGYCPDMCVYIMTTSTPPKNRLNTIFFSKYLQSLPFIDHKSLDRYECDASSLFMVLYYSLMFRK